MKIAVTGKNGQLGSEFQFLAQNYREMDFMFLGLEELDISNQRSVERFFGKDTFDIIINCAAYTAVDKAEDEPEKAFAVNETGVSNLVKACMKYGMRLMHYSTDYVFNGKSYSPYVETDKVDPIGVYGKSKLAGEKAMLNSEINGLIIRTSWVYSEFGNNFVKTMIRLGREREELSVIFDQVGSPTNARDLAVATLEILRQPEKWKQGIDIYHFSNEGVCSWYDFALAIHQQQSIDCKVKPILTKDYPTKAKRPYYSVLDKSKIKRDFGVEILHWESSLGRMLKSFLKYEKAKK